MRLLRQHGGDIGLVMRLNAQYESMVLTSVSVHGRLMRVQALRQKRRASVAAANEDAWALHVAEQSMLDAVEQDSRLPDAPAPAVAPAAGADQSNNVSKTGADSHDAAFETWLSAQLGSARGWDETDLRDVLRQAIANSRSANSNLAARNLPVNGRESSGRAD